MVMLLMAPTLALICFFICELKPISDARVDPFFSFYCSIFFLLDDSGQPSVDAAPSDSLPPDANRDGLHFAGGDKFLQPSPTHR